MVLGLFVGLVLGVGIGGASKQSPSAPTQATASSPNVGSVQAPQNYAAAPEPVAPAAPQGIVAGTYVVGADIQPGTYHTTGPSADSAMKMCTWSRNKDTSGEFSSIIANHVTQGPDTMTVKPTDAAVEFVGDCTWTKIK